MIFLSVNSSNFIFQIESRGLKKNGLRQSKFGLENVIGFHSNSLKVENCHILRSVWLTNMGSHYSAGETRHAVFHTTRFLGHVPNSEEAERNKV